MIVLYNPKVTRPPNRRFPLSILSIAAMLEGREEYAIVDGNLDPRPQETIAALLRENPVELLAVTVMPGPQTRSAVETLPALRKAFPRVPTVWGGYFASNYTQAALNAPYVDYAVRGQGEDTFCELLDALRGRRGFEGILGLSYKDRDGRHVHNPERPMKSLGAFPWFPYHRVPVEEYLLPTYLGRRTAVHHASIGCPYACNFCGVVTFSGSREKVEPPERTAAVLEHLAKTYGADAVQFYDNNFFLREDYARDFAERITPLKMRWWCEGRIDILLRYSDATLEAIKRAGCTMVYLGAESGSDWVLKEMKKQLKIEQTLELAARIRRFGIIPEFSFVIGNPQDPERDTAECLRFIRKLKRLNPESEIIINTYTPVPQRTRMYGGVEDQVQFPDTPEEWATDRWQRFTTQRDPSVPWLRARTKRLIDDFDVVVTSRWPTIQDIRMPAWGRRLLKVLSDWRYRLRVYAFPLELKWMRQYFRLRNPKEESL
jgi:anaerobic magnesium-protoporphyrin IX monomethyl ester cyclase